MSYEIIIAECDGATDEDVAWLRARVKSDRRGSGSKANKRLRLQHRVWGRAGSKIERWERRFFPCCETSAYWVGIQPNGRPVRHEVPTCPTCRYVEALAFDEEQRRAFARKLVEHLQTPMLVALDEAELGGRGVSFGLRELHAQLDALALALHNLEDERDDGGLEVRMSYEPDRKVYVASLELGEFYGMVEAHTLEHLLRALPLLSEEVPSICVGPDGTCVCTECLGEGCGECKFNRMRGVSVLGAAP